MATRQRLPRPAEEGPEPCNTGPSKCKKGRQQEIQTQTPGSFDPSKVRVVNWGVDALYTTYDGDLVPWIVEILEALKLEAQQDDAPVAWTDFLLFGEPINVHQRGGVKGYKYHVSNAKCDAYLVGSGRNQPALWLQPKAEFLKEIGPGELVRRQRQEVAPFFQGIPQERANRLDLHADLVGVPWEAFDVRVLHDRMEVMNATYRAQDVQPMSKRGKLTGFNVGKRTGSTYLRIYDKTQEIAGHGHLGALAEGELTHYLPEIWSRYGWSGQTGVDAKGKPVFERVIRVEYELTRDTLKQFRQWSSGEPFVETWDNALPLLNSIWRYCVLKWFVVRVPGEAKQKTRWQRAEWWEKLAELVMVDGPQAIGARVCQKSSKKRKLAELLAGAASSLGALEGLSQDEALVHAVSLMKSEFATKPYDERKGKKCRSFRARIPLDWLAEQEGWQHRRTLVFATAM